MKPMKPMEPMRPMEPPARWWPEDLGSHADSVGGQDNTRYAFFEAHKRVAVDTGDGKVTVYDTGDRRISGVRQDHRDGSSRIIFTGQDGEVDLASLARV